MRLNHKNIIIKIKNKFQSIRIKLFTTLCLTVAVIIVFLILINNFVLERYYLYSKQALLIKAYEKINACYNGTIKTSNIELELERLAVSNDFDILIKTDTTITYASSRDFISSLILSDVEYKMKKGTNENILFTGNNVEIKKTVDKQTDMSFILLSAELDSGAKLYIRVAVASIQESAKIANKLFMSIGFITIIISGMIVLVISRKFTSKLDLEVLLLV